MQRFWLNATLAAWGALQGKAGPAATWLSGKWICTDTKKSSGMPPHPPPQGLRPVLGTYAVAITNPSPCPVSG